MMVATSLEHLEVQVPINTGPLIGNTLRQFAMRGTNTWQAAAYKLGSKEGSFGLSGGYNFSYLKLLPGKLVCHDEVAPGTEMLCKFDLANDKYIHNGMEIVNLPKLGAPSLDVCLVYASGSRTAKQNQTVVERLCPSDADDFVAVPSKHTPTVKFRFEVKPFSLEEETLLIDATPASVALARKFAVELLSGLNISPQ